MADLERIKMLIDALRSGEYQQCKGILITRIRGERRYCATGVASKVAAEHGASVTIATPEFGHPYFVDTASETQHHTAMPLSALEWYGMDEMVAVHVVTMNDASKTFGEIAWWLEDVYKTQSVT